MIFQLQDLDKASALLLPEDCRSCGWWQGKDGGWASSMQADSWEEAALESFGSWGKLAIGDDELLGMIQYGPAVLFSRSGDFACGPTSVDAVLLTCSIVSGSINEPIRKSLLTAVLAELKEREIPTVEAFCYQNETPEEDCRLFDQEFLRGCGFYPVRSSGGLQLMRLELGGMEPAKTRRQKTRRRLLERIKRTSPSPAPAATCQSQEKSSGRIPLCP